MSRNIVEARFCAEKSCVVLIYKLEKKTDIKQHEVIDFEDAQDVCKALGFDGDIKQVQEADLYRSTGS